MIKRFIKKHDFLVQVFSFYLLTVVVIFVGSLVYLKLDFKISILVIFFIIFCVSYFAPFLAKIFLKSKIYNGKYRNLINKYIKKNKIRINNIYERKSKSSNAFACSFFKNKSVVYFSNTLEKHPWGEIEAVTAHEIGHHVNNDPLLLTFVIAFIAALFGLVNFILGHLVYLSILESIVICPLFLSIQRWRESLADKYAYKVLENPRLFADFFRKLIIFSENDGVKVNRNPNYLSKIFFTHPPMYERIALFESKKLRNN